MDNRKWRVEPRGIYWICTNGRIELGPVFEARISAFEVLDGYLNMHPFFTSLPVLPHGTPTPRTEDHVKMWHDAGRPTK